MPKEEIKELVKENFNIDNEQVRDVVVQFIMESYVSDLELAEWEQIRFVKQRVDELWQKLKRLSEMVLVKEKVKQMMQNFPRPADILASRRVPKARVSPQKKRR